MWYVSSPVIATYVIGLREGLEAALIVGIVAAFLRQQGQRAALRYVWIGVAIAVTVCIAVGVALQILDEELPQRQQEQLETVVGLFAVLIVTFMIVWMRRHAAGLRGELERSAAAAVATGSVLALVGMALFAVLREGLETAVFLLAAFQAAENSVVAGLGALLGILTAVVIGAGLYRGGIKLNLARFFRITSVFLVLVAAGLLATAAHTAHEAAWLNSLQGQALDLSWLVVPGTVTSVAADRDARAAAAAHSGRGGHLPALRGADARVRAVAPRSPDAPRPAEHNHSGGQCMISPRTGAAICCTIVATAGVAGCGSSGSGAKDAKKVAVTLVDGGCTPSQIKVASGPVTFDITNGGTSKVSEMELRNSSGIILGESENVVEGVPGHFALKSGQVQRAKALYGPTRIHYEAIEPVAESFGNLDPEIDARVNDVTDPKHGRREYALEQGPGHPAAARAARQRGRRVDERGIQLEDHRRGGPLLAHRPIGLRRAT